MHRGENTSPFLWFSNRRNYQTGRPWKVLIKLAYASLCSNTQAKSSLEERFKSPEVYMLLMCHWWSRFFLFGCQKRPCSLAPSNGFCVVVQSPSHVRLFVTPWIAACWASLSFTIFRSLLKLTSIESVMPDNHFVLCCPLLLPPPVLPSIRVFSNESVLPIRWPKYWSFSFSTSPSNEYSWLTSLRIDWFDLPAAQGTLKSFLWHHSSKASILQWSAF